MPTDDEHYHTPGDEANTIDFKHMARVTQLVFATAWQVANQDARIARFKDTGLITNGYVCPVCPFECDDEVYEHPGSCPVCGMNLVPNIKVKK
jgi:rubrerythrin